MQYDEKPTLQGNQRKTTINDDVKHQMCTQNLPNIDIKKFQMPTIMIQIVIGS